MRRFSLIEPFPTDRLSDLFHWLNTSMIARSGQFPDSDGFAEKIGDLSGMRSWGVVDSSDEALIGAAILEPVGTMGARSYVASARRAWGKGIMEEAVTECISRSFAQDRNLAWIAGMVVANNMPARHFNERIGMRLKNILPEFAEQGGKRRDLYVYEMDREQWERASIFEVTRPRWAA